MKKISGLSFILLIIVFGISCKKNNDPSPASLDYTVPSTYNFSNFNESNQLILLAMADQVVATINLANTTPHTVVSAQTLTEMFNNTGGHFNDSALQLNASGLKLSDYFPAGAREDILHYFDSVGVYSQSAAAAAPGIAGVSSSSASPNKKYLLSPNGVFYSQVVKKEIMGVCAYLIANVYLKDSVSNSVDNTTIVTGSGTAMEHHWDEAFGFFGVPADFPANTKGLRYFGSYSNQVDAGLHSNASIMNAFLKGRAAISNKDLTGKDEQAHILIATFDTLDAACIVQEMKETDENIEAGDAVAAYGTLSEALGFVRNMKYNTDPSRVISNTQISQLLALFDSDNPDSPDLYKFVGADVNSVAQIEAKTDAIRQFIAGIYGFAGVELQNL